MDIYIIRIIYYCVLIAGICIGIKNFQKLEIGYKWIFLLLLITLITELIAYYLAVKIKNSNPIYHVNTVLYFSILNVIFYYFTESKRIKIFCIYSIPVFALIAIANIIFHDGIYSFPAIPSSLDGIKNIFLSFALYYSISNNVDDKPLTKNTVFIFNTAVLLFNVLTILSFTLKKFLIEINNFSLSMIVFHIIFWSSILYYCVLGYILFLAKKTDS